MLNVISHSNISCWYLTLRGIVQGIGFRPFVYRLAQEFGLSGWVENTAAGVVIVVEGTQEALEDFFLRLQTTAPPFAQITEVERICMQPLGLQDFSILSSHTGRGETGLPADIATCPQCVEETFSSQDRRFQYPFTNCTECGPRFTITHSLPYDRATTTMADFELCAACQTEYQNVADRRFHAQPIACPQCGPQVWLEITKGKFYPPSQGTAQGTAITQAATLLRHGALIAVKGLGGFHLVCDATNEQAVLRLRQVKDRQDKPLAIMVETIAAARCYGQGTEAEADLLSSAQAPIVLIQKNPASSVVPAVAPGVTNVGIMLAYTPLHHLLLRAVGRPLVMTSGNRRDEPLCKTEQEAKEAFGGQIDALLLHDRPIHQRCDDSVFFVADTGLQPIRRSRGYTPLPVPLPFTSPVPVLGLGAELKNTFCLLRGSEAFPSQYIGDMGSLATQQHFAEALERLKALLKIRPAVVAHDLHPDYATTRYASCLDLPQIPVQHHHAHVAACLAENAGSSPMIGPMIGSVISPVIGPVIGVVFDGTGYGTDGAIWGGEFLVADFHAFERVAHLEYLPLPGGEAAIRHPYRTALAYLLTLCGTLPPLPFLRAVSASEVRLLSRVVERRINTPLTSSCGRLFDAVAALIGLRQHVSYEAQAAIELEAVSESAPCDPSELAEFAPYPFSLDGQQIRLAALFGQLVEDLKQDVPPAVIGWRFHLTLGDMVHAVCCQIREQRGITHVALSGGCFQNRLLLSITCKRLQAAGFTVYTHRQVPTNDGGISLGQAVVAAARIAGSPKEIGENGERGVRCV